MWYGKAPGLDRAADSLRHGNFVGVSRTGGALAVVGDDPSCKSSTIPSASESLLAEPAHAGVLPRQRGRGDRPRPARLRLLARLRAVGRLQDRHERGRRGRDRRGGARPRLPGPARPRLRARAERQPAAARRRSTWSAACSACARDLALAYARENGVNRIEGARDAWLGIVAAGKPYYDLQHALRSLGLDERALERAGIRVLKLGMIWPLEQERRARVRRRPRRDPGGRGEGPVRRDASSRRRSTAPPARRASSASATSSGEPLLPMELDVDADLVARAVAAACARAGCGSTPSRPTCAGSTSSTARPRRAADGAARPVLLLGLPAQLLDQGARGHARGRRHRLPHDGAAEPRGQGRDHRHHADGRRGRPVDRPGAVHRRPPPRPEPGRRHLPPLRLAGRARGGRRGREHHLQAALQRARRDDRRPGDRGPAVGARPDALARARGRAPDHRHRRGHEPLQGRRAGVDRRAARPLAAARRPAGAGARSRA